MNLNVEIGCNNSSCEGSKIDPEFEPCQSCGNVPYGRVAYNEDCSKFCECVQGKPSKIGSCPSGLNFNSKLHVCDFIKSANCSTVTTDNPENCESCEDIDYGFVPFDNDCSKFCECYNGKASKVKQCSKGLLFNGFISNCDYSSNTTCKYGETTTSAPKTPIAIATPEPGECTKCDSVETTGAVPDEFSCQKYCICKANKGVEVRTCETGLYFDPDTKACEEDNDSICLGSTFAQTSPSPSTFDPNCDCGTSTDLIPFNGSCTKYCDCDDRAVYECPGNLYYNPNTTQCARPSEVQCAW